MTSSITVLISSAGRRVALMRSFQAAVAKCAGANGRVIATDTSPLSSAAWEADAYFRVPRCVERDYIPFMLEMCRRENVDLIVPTIDTELEVLSEHREEFVAVGTEVLVSSREVVRIAGDKRLTHEFLVREKLPTVRQATVESIPADISSWGLPLIAKPRCGSASIGLQRITQMSAIPELPAGYVVEEWATGDEYTMDILLDVTGRAEVVVPRRRLETRAGEVSKSVTCDIPTLRNEVARLCDRLPGARGVLTVQAFFDGETEQVSIIEVNPRFGGGFPLSDAAGAKYPLALVERIMGLKPSHDPADWEDGLTMLRYDEAVLVPAERMAQLLRQNVVDGSRNDLV